MVVQKKVVYFNKKRQSVLFKGIKAEKMMLATFSERNQVSKAICIDGFAFQNLRRERATVTFS